MDSPSDVGLFRPFDRFSSGLTTIKGVMFALSVGGGYVKVSVNFH